MARGGDLTKTLGADELARVRALLAENPPDMPEPGQVTQYPRMLFHKNYLDNQQAWKDEVDDLKKKKFVEKMASSVHIVLDIEEEEEFLLDGWKRSPADFLPPDKDPRIPVGREARRVAAQQRLSREDEIQQLRLRLAELTGRQAPMATEAPAPRRRRRRTIRRRPSQVAKATAVADGPPPVQS